VARVAPIVSPLEGVACSVPILNCDPTTHTMETTLVFIYCQNLDGISCFKNFTTSMKEQ
jgi:hypothetical protein